MGHMWTNETVANRPRSPRCGSQYLVGFGLQVFEVFLGPGQALVVLHVPLHHLVVRVLE